jgi:2',3'-cyclic-nucleotide 2'-phosphodiesterase (5'-nucleotidase family)
LTGAAPRAFVAALLLAAAGACATVTPGAEPEAPLRLRVLHTNDFHGRLHPQDLDGRQVGGSAALAAHFDSARVRFDGPTILLSAGDDFQGTALSNLSWGRAVVDVFNHKRYDAAALGNHEFDWGQDTLQARIAEGNHPRLAANLFEAGTDRHPPWALPWTMIERGGVRAAVIGLALETTPEVVMAGRTQGLEFRAAPPAVDRYAREARGRGAQFVVVVAHVGAVCAEPGQGPTEPSAGCEGRLLEIAREVTEPVDLWIGGHTHVRNFTDVDGVPVMQAYRFGLAFGVVDLERAGQHTRVLHRSIQRPWVDVVDPDTALARVVGDWDAAVRPVTERAVATLAADMGNYDRQPGEFPLGHLIADAHRAGTGADVAFVNVGSIRRGLPAGAVTYGILYELQPFQNELVIVHMEGRHLREALEIALGDDGRPRAHLSGLTVHYDPHAEPGRRVTRLVLDSGREVGPGDTVSVATTEFVASGGDGYLPFLDGRWSQTGLVDLDALVDHLRAQPQPVVPPSANRWRPGR